MSKDSPHEPRGISPQELEARLLTPENCILIDARPYSEYLLSHINGALSVRLSSLMTRRLAKGTNTLYDLVIQEQKEKYKQIYNLDNSTVIVYDKDTPAAKVASEGKSPLQVIIRSLRKASKPCCYVDGGFKAVENETPDLIHVPEFEGTPFPSLDTNISSVSEGGPPYIDVQQSPCYNIQTMQASEVTSNIYIGSRRDACDKSLLNRLGIKGIVNATMDCPHHFEKDDSFLYHRVPVKDTWNQDLPSHFSKCFQFIESIKSMNAKVLIHCTAGVSRSATLTIAYLMWSKRESLADSYAFVKGKRPIISPNLDFMGELQQYEKNLGIGNAKNKPAAFTNESTSHQSSTDTTPTLNSIPPTSAMVNSASLVFSPPPTV